MVKASGLRLLGFRLLGFRLLGFRASELPPFSGANVSVK